MTVVIREYDSGRKSQAEFAQVRTSETFQSQWHGVYINKKRWLNIKLSVSLFVDFGASARLHFKGVYEAIDTHLEPFMKWMCITSSLGLNYSFTR